eukprot:GHVS01091589.1.p1 GENE.GHVS01091589.1~~GHVS01091589.1.p1  ORF type:complete len:150 (+),score=26.73 GHVS01091589.1:132-581(+)
MDVSSSSSSGGPTNSSDVTMTSPGEQTAAVQPTTTSSSCSASADVLYHGEPRFEVRKWSGVALWAWDIVVDNCAICRNHIMDMCIECQAGGQTCGSTGSGGGGGDGGDCKIAWGVCNHAFHLHCITRWLKTRQVCPLDNTDWELQKLGT